MPDNPYFKRFQAAFNYLLDRDWKRRQKVLAIEVGVSEGFISSIKKGMTAVGDELQIAFAEKMGYKNFDDFINLGKWIIETGEPPSPDNLIQHDNNVVAFTKIENHHDPTPEERRLQKMHENLDAIFNSGDAELICAIEMNLISFRKTIDLQKKTKELEMDRDLMRDQIQKIIQKNGV
jgi:hypothetical protein